MRAHYRGFFILILSFKASPPAQVVAFKLSSKLWLPSFRFKVVAFELSLPILVDFGHSGHKQGMVFALYPLRRLAFKMPRFHDYRKENQQTPFTNYVYGNLTFG